jgi:O-antigen ligase
MPLILLALGVYAAAIPLPNDSLISEDLRLRLFNVRPYILVTILVVALVERLYHLGGGKIFLSGAERRAFVLSLIFPAYYLAVSLVKGTYSAPVAGLYVAWSLFAFLLTPMLIRTVRDVRVVSAVLIVANVATWGFAFGYERLSQGSAKLIYGGPYGYINGDYFAQVALVTVASALIYVTARRGSGLHWKPWQATVVFLAFLGGGVFVGILAARSAVAFLAIGAVTYMVLRRGRNVWVAHSFLLIGLLLIVSALAFPENKTLDETTSKRLSLWRTAVETINHEPTPVLPLLTGTTVDNLETSAYSKPYDPLGAGKAFSKFHVDNSFLELFLEGGLLGLVLFLLPYIVIVRTGIANLGSSSSKTTLMATSLGLLVGLAFLSLTTTTIPTFNSPVGLFAAFFGALPAIVARVDVADEEKAVSARAPQPPLAPT